MLGVLKELRARQIEVLLNSEWQITDEVILQEYACPYEAFASFSESDSEVPFDETILTDVIARLWGADNWDNIKVLPERTLEQFEKLLVNRVNERRLVPMTESLGGSFSQLVEELRTQRPLEGLRTPLGLGKGRAGNVNPTNAIPEIWELIKDQCGGLSISSLVSINRTSKDTSIGQYSWGLRLATTS